MISGLLKKRKQLMGYILETRNDLAKLGEDLRSIDRTLEAFQYNGNIPLTQRSERVVLFFRGELTNWIMLQLSQATGPISSRQIAESFVQLKGSPDDHRLEKDIVRRVGKAVAKLRQKGKVKTTTLKGNVKVHELIKTPKKDASHIDNRVDIDFKESHKD